MPRYGLVQRRCRRADLYPVGGQPLPLWYTARHTASGSRSPGRSPRWAAHAREWGVRT